MVMMLIMSGCGKKQSSPFILVFKTDAERIEFAKKPEYEKYKDWGIRRVDIYHNNNFSGDTSLGNISSSRIYDENGYMISEAVFLDRDTIISLYKWYQFDKPSAVYLYDQNKNLRQKNIYYYDTKGNLFEANLNGKRKYYTILYDREGRLAQVIPSDYANDEIKISVQNNYNSDGSKVETKKTTTVGQEAEKTITEFDIFGKITKSQSFGKFPKVMNYLYNKLDQLEKVVSQSDVDPKLNNEEIYTYDPELKLISIITKNSNGAEVKKISFHYSR